MKYSIWGNPKDTTHTSLIEGINQPRYVDGTLFEDGTLIEIFDAESWEEAEKYYDTFFKVNTNDS